MQGARTGNMGFSRSTNTKKSLIPVMNKTEFLEKFYKPPEESIKKDSNTSSEYDRRQTMLGSTKRRGKVDINEFHDTHKKLFNRDVKFFNRADKKKSNFNNITGSTQDISFFDKFKKDYSDPFEKAKEASATLGQIVIVNTCMFACGLISLLQSLIGYNFEYNEDYNTKLYVLLSLCMFFSIIEGAFFILKLKLKVKLQIYRKEAHELSGIKHVYRLQDVAPTFLFILIHPSPLLVGVKFWIYNETIQNLMYYHVNDFLCMIMTIKWIYITTLIIFRSLFANSRSNRVCNMFQTTCDKYFIIKCLLKEDPFKYIFICFFAGIAIFGNLQMIAEAPLDRVVSGFTKHNFINSCWSAICTMTTVGYGDIFPRTLLGRLLAFFCSQYGGVIVSLLMVACSTVIAMDNSQSCAFTVIKKLQARETLKKVAASLLVTINKKTDKSNVDNEYRRYCKIKSLIDEFRQLRFQYKNIKEITTQEIIEQYFGSCISHLTDIKDMVIDQNEWFEEMFYNEQSSEGSLTSSDSSDVHYTNVEKKPKSKFGRSQKTNSKIDIKITPTMSMPLAMQLPQSAKSKFQESEDQTYSSNQDTLKPTPKVTPKINATPLKNRTPKHRFSMMASNLMFQYKGSQKSISRIHDSDENTPSNSQRHINSRRSSIHRDASPRNVFRSKRMSKLWDQQNAFKSVDKKPSLFAEQHANTKLGSPKSDLRNPDIDNTIPLLQSFSNNKSEFFNKKARKIGTNISSRSSLDCSPKRQWTGSAEKIRSKRQCSLSNATEKNKNDSINDISSTDSFRQVELPFGSPNLHSSKFKNSSPKCEKIIEEKESKSSNTTENEKKEENYIANDLRKNNDGKVAQKEKMKSRNLIPNFEKLATKKSESKEKSSSTISSHSTFQKEEHPKKKDKLKIPLTVQIPRSLSMDKDVRSKLSQQKNKHSNKNEISLELPGESPNKTMNIIKRPNKSIKVQKKLMDIDPVIIKSRAVKNTHDSQDFNYEKVPKNTEEAYKSNTSEKSPNPKSPNKYKTKKSIITKNSRMDRIKVPTQYSEESDSMSVSDNSFEKEIKFKAKLKEKARRRSRSINKFKDQCDSKDIKQYSKVNTLRHQSTLKNKKNVSFKTSTIKHDKDKIVGCEEEFSLDSQIEFDAGSIEDNLKIKEKIKHKKRRMSKSIQGQSGYDNERKNKESKTLLRNNTSQNKDKKRQNTEKSFKNPRQGTEKSFKIQHQESDKNSDTSISQMDLEDSSEEKNNEKLKRQETKKSGSKKGFKNLAQGIAQMVRKRTKVHNDIKPPKQGEKRGMRRSSTQVPVGSINPISFKEHNANYNTNSSYIPRKQANKIREKKQQAEIQAANELKTFNNEHINTLSKFIGTKELFKSAQKKYDKALDTGNLYGNGMQPSIMDAEINESVEEMSETPRENEMAEIKETNSTNRNILHKDIAHQTKLTQILNESLANSHCKDLQLDILTKR